MAFYLIFRPLAGLLEPIGRPDPTSIQKMMAEGGLCEVITFLGWVVDTRRLTVALPVDKWKAWSAQITTVRKARRVRHKDIAQLVGRLNHVCFIIPNM